MDDQVTKAVTGQFTDATRWFLSLGAISTVDGAGILLLAIVEVTKNSDGRSCYFRPSECSFPMTSMD
jgi:hypothetical protein